MFAAMPGAWRPAHGRLSVSPLRGRPEKGTGCVAALVRATSPPCTPLLAGALLRAILAIADHEVRAPFIFSTIDCHILMPASFIGPQARASSAKLSGVMPSV